MSHIFISYSKKDIDFARHLRKLLQDKGFAVWMDDTKLVPSERWWSTIEANIKTCAAFLVIMSPNSQNSEWVEREILVAEDPENKKPIFPVLLAGKRWTRLANIQYEEMFEGENSTALSSDFADALQRVAPTFSGISAPPPLPMNKKQASNKSRDILIAVIGAIALIIAAAIGILPPMLERLDNANATSTAQAATQRVLALTPTLNPVEVVQTYDANATSEIEIREIARQTTTAQALLDFNASATAQTTLDAEASAIARINAYNTATALASITPSVTNTPTATATASRTPTLTPSPFPTSSILSGNVSVTFRDEFDGTRLSSSWEVWNLGPEIENGVMTFTGRGSWDDGLARSGIRENEGILLLFQVSTSLHIEINLQKGVFTSSSWRRWTFANWGGWEVSAFYNASDSQSRNFARPTIEGNTWYYLLYRVGDDGRFYTQIWEQGATRFLVNIGTSSLGDGWDDGNWDLVIKVNSGTFRAASYEELLFPTDYIMPSVPGR